MYIFVNLWKSPFKNTLIFIVNMILNFSNLLRFVLSPNAWLVYRIFHMGISYWWKCSSLLELFGQHVIRVQYFFVDLFDCFNCPPSTDGPPSSLLLLALFSSFVFLTVTLFPQVLQCLQLLHPPDELTRLSLSLCLYDSFLLVIKHKHSHLISFDWH